MTDSKAYKIALKLFNGKKLTTVQKTYAVNNADEVRVEYNKICRDNPLK